MSQYFHRCLTNGTDICNRQNEPQSQNLDLPSTSQPAQRQVLKKTGSVKRTSMAVATAEKQILSDEDTTLNTYKKPKKTVKLTDEEQNILRHK